MSTTAAQAPPSADNARAEMIAWGTLAGLLVLLILSYLNSLSVTWEKWENPQYSHGYLVPIFALVLLWLRKQPLPALVAPWERWAGCGVLAAGLALRLITTLFALVIPEMLSLIPCVLGLFLLVGGLATLRWSWPAIAFLVFMYPLPDFIERGLLDPLQHLATLISTFALQTLGFSAYSEGNRINLGEIQMGVVDACSGLRMLTIFLALATAITLVTERPWWERIVIVASAIPIALTVNVIRITVTGILYATVSGELADKVFHDFAGWVMMPMALGLLYIELQILSHLFIEEEQPALDLGLGGQFQ